MRNIDIKLFVLFAVTAIGTSFAAAQDAPKAKHHRYRVVDVGTFGGPNADVLLPPPSTQILNKFGIFVGAGETNLADPFAPNCFNGDCVVEQPFLRWNGRSIKLPSLKDGVSGIPVSVNDFGVAVGYAQNGSLDPLAGTPEVKAALWTGGEVFDLGTLGGNGASANAINNRGQIFGGALNTIPDANPFFPFFVPGATQVHAVLWERGSVRDLGTLGGTDSVVYQANELGQAMGISFTDGVIHEFDLAGEHYSLPTTHPFLWEQGIMHDVGSLGGGFSQGYGLNNRGEVVGFSFLEGDIVRHPILWREGALTDLGTLGGNNGDAVSINDRGHITGSADLPHSEVHHAFLWRNGKMKDLGTPHGNPCSGGETINRFDQVVGDSGKCGNGGDPFLWENDDIVALRDLILPGSGHYVYDAFDINDRGEIVSLCATEEAPQHVCLLVPVNDSEGSQSVETTPDRVSSPHIGNYPETGERRRPFPSRLRKSATQDR